MTQHSVVQKYRFSQSPMASPCTSQILIEARIQRLNKKRHWIQFFLSCVPFI